MLCEGCAYTIRDNTVSTTAVLSLPALLSSDYMPTCCVDVLCL